MSRILEGFDEAGFREGIGLAMTMAQPEDAAHRPVFVIEGEVLPDVAYDASGTPWDPDGVRAEVEAVEVSDVLCVVEFGPAVDSDADIQPQDVTITFLDDEYERVKGFKYVKLWPAGTEDHVKFFFRQVLMRVNLDAVGVWQVRCAAGDTQ